MSKDTCESQVAELSDQQLEQVSGGGGGVFVAAGDLPEKNGDHHVYLADLNQVRNNFGAGL